MVDKSYPLYLANRPSPGAGSLQVRDKFSGQVLTDVARADARVIEAGIAAAAAARDACRRMPAYQRAAALHHVSSRIRERQELFARVLVAEAGKPIRDARGEVGRAIDTFTIAAEEATRLSGEFLPLDISPRSRGCEAISRFVPVGPCSLIAPFNFPLNLVAHKVAPAIAAGCPWVLKPASKTPVTALLLGQILAETDLPPGAFSILPCARDGADLFITDERLKLISFTGSPDVGWAIKARAGKKMVVLELGGNAGCIVDRDSDIEHVVGRLIFGAFYQSGQSCISVQRILIHETCYAAVRDQLVEAARQLRWGDPASEDTFLGPLISEEAAGRVESWVDSAVRRGAHVLCGGRRHDQFYEATLLEAVPDDCEVSCQEVFGPVAVLEPFRTMEAACQRVNESRYGLQAGVFTQSLDAAFHAFNELEVGGVVINDVPSFRVDAMPYGGVKDSGLGREGVRYAMREMTEPRLMVLAGIGHAKP